MESEGQNNTVTSTVLGATRFYWLFAVFWNALSIPLCFMLPREIVKGNHLALVGLFFPIAGIFLVAVAVRKVLQWRKFGSLILAMDPFPGSIGGEVGGIVELPLNNFRQGNDFRVSLSCIRVRVSGTIRNRTRHEDLIWRSHGRALAEPAAAGTRLKFKFGVPQGLPQSGQPSDDYHKWVVEVKSNLPGIDLDQGFVVPMVDTANPAASSLRIEMPCEPVAPLPSHMVRIYHAPEGLIFYYPARRNLKFGLLLFFFGIIFAGSAVFWSYSSVGSCKEPLDCLFVSAAFVLQVVIDLVAAMLIAGAVYSLINSLTVEIGLQNLTVTRALFGLNVFKRMVSLSDIAYIQAVRTGQRGTGTNAKVLYAVKAYTRDGRRITVGDGIEDADVADQIKLSIDGARGLREGI